MHCDLKFESLSLFCNKYFFFLKNIRCHNGKEDKTGHWCECNKGWVSAPFDQKYFNPDIQVYHMCTVWTGKMTAEEARDITVLPKPRYKTLNIVIVSFNLLFVSYIYGAHNHVRPSSF